MKKKCVLFGAGAEAPFGISCGDVFSMVTAGINTEEMDEAISKYYKSIHFDEGFYPTYKNYTLKEDAFYKAAATKKILSEFPYPDQVNKFEAKVNEYSQDIDLKQYTSFFGVLDEKFHTIMQPKALGPVKFWQTVICYTRAYLCIAGALAFKKTVRDITEDEYFELLNDKLATYKLLEKRAKELEGQDSYYKIIRQCREVSVITTNYTPLAKVITGKDVAYPHGRMDLFESAKENYVYNISDTRFQEICRDDILFPFILIQSGIKPIIADLQLREYKKAIEYLDEAEEIIILGFRLNIDDNHINSMLKSQLYKDKKIKYFDFDDSGREEVLRRLQWIDDNNIDVIPINKDDGYEKFKECFQNELKHEKNK